MGGVKEGGAGSLETVDVVHFNCRPLDGATAGHKLPSTALGFRENILIVWTQEAGRFLSFTM